MKPREERRFHIASAHHTAEVLVSTGHVYSIAAIEPPDPTTAQALADDASAVITSDWDDNDPRYIKRGPYRAAVYLKGCSRMKQEFQITAYIIEGPPPAQADEAHDVYDTLGIPPINLSPEDPNS